MTDEPGEKIGVNEATEFLERRAQQIRGEHAPLPEYVEEAFSEAYEEIRGLNVRVNHYLQEAQRHARYLAWLVDDNDGVLEIPIEELDPSKRSALMLAFEIDEGEGIVRITLEDPPPPSAEASA